MKPYSGKIILMFVFLLLQALATLLIPTLMSDIVNEGILTGELSRI